MGYEQLEPGKSDLEQVMHERPMMHDEQVTKVKIRQRSRAMNIKQPGKLDHEHVMNT